MYRSSGSKNVVAAPLATNITLVASNSLWKYNDEGVDLGTTWTNVIYSEATWSNGLARLGFGGDGEVTTVRGQPRVTYYFRKQFLVPAGYSGTNVVMKLSRDISPVSSHVASIRMPGTLSGVIVMPCSAAAIALPSSLPAFSAAALIM